MCWRWKSREQPKFISSRPIIIINYYLLLLLLSLFYHIIVSLQRFSLLFVTQALGEQLRIGPADLERARERGRARERESERARERESERGGRKRE